MLTVDLQPSDRRPAGAPDGTIENPGVDAVVQLDIQAESVPIDDALKKAMPPDVRKVVDQFNPSGLVKAARQGLPQADAGGRHAPKG